MAKYKRPFTDILQDVIDNMNVNIQILSVTDNTNGVQTISCCDIFYSQKGFDVTINDLSYKIIDFSQANETLTLKANFTGAYLLTVGTIFTLYKLHFFYGTPISAQSELNLIKKAELKTPMIYLWENYKEKFYAQDIIERKTSGVQLYALTQPPKDLMKMLRKDIQSECVNPMRRAIDCFYEEIQDRCDIFSADDLEYDTEEFARFGIVARNAGAQKSVMMDKLSGVAGYSDLELFYKDECECPAILITQGIGSDIIGSTLIVY